MYILECFKPFTGRRIIIAPTKKRCLELVPEGYQVDKDKLTYDSLVIDSNHSKIDYYLENEKDRGNENGIEEPTENS